MEFKKLIEPLKLAYGTSIHVIYGIPQFANAFDTRLKLDYSIISAITKEFQQPPVISAKYAEYRHLDKILIASTDSPPIAVSRRVVNSSVVASYLIKFIKDIPLKQAEFEPLLEYDSIEESTRISWNLGEAMIHLDLNIRGKYMIVKLEVGIRERSIIQETRLIQLERIWKCVNELISNSTLEALEIN
jgi:hypothetical protein